MHQYQLQKYTGIKSRHRCPACNHRNKTFTLYINTDTSEPLNARVGKCDRLDKCGYHYTPRQWFGQSGKVAVTPAVCSKYKKYDGKNSATATASATIGNFIFKASLKHYHNNNLVVYLNTVLGADITRMLIERYHIGTAKHWPGATVFWQVDIKGQIRAGKVMLYNAASGKRVKQPYNHIAWAHTLLQRREKLDVRFETTSHLNTQISILKSDFKLSQCLFGEHLLAGNNMPVAIVESEKTALISSTFIPQYLWLATGGITNLSVQKCQVLKGRKVYLFPDLNAFDAWQAKRTQLLGIAQCKLSNLLELNANTDDRANGLDLADFLLRGNATLTLP